MAPKKQYTRAPKKRTTPGKPSPVTRIFVFTLLAVLSLLLLFAISINNESILKDYGDFSDNVQSISDLFSLDYPFNNPIGPFGVIFGYLSITLLGRFFSYFFWIGLFSVCMIRIFKPQDYRLVARVIFGTAFFFFVQILLLSFKDSFDFGFGYLPWSLAYFFDRLFSSTGSVIISLFSGVVFLILALEVSTIQRWLQTLFTGRVEEAQKPVSKPLKSPTVAPNIQHAAPTLEDAKEELEEMIPNIIDHVLQENHIPVEEEPKAVKSRNKVKPVEEVPEEDNREYIKPNINDYLVSPVKLTKRDREETEEAIRNVSRILRDKLSEFGIDAEVINVNIGPIITQYELKPAPGVKVARFLSLADDLALAIKAKSVRVQAPIPGRGLIGIEIPNLNRDMIYLKDILLSEEMKQNDKTLTIGLGKDISGKSIVTDLAKMPHLLIAGATGSGKSVCINTLIVSLILRTSPAELRMVLIDPKRVELAGYEGLPHLIGDVVTDPDDALETMNWAVREMEKRYELLQEQKVRDITSFNQKVQEDADAEHKPLPYIVIIVDEFADLIMTAGRDIELPITRLAQMARAVGIHLILATQRPSIKVITGLIKANFPSRIAFQVSSKVDSRVILDMMGAERLLGQGDMLFLPPGKAIPDRIHGAFVSDDEITNLCDYLKTQPKPREDYQISAVARGGVEKFEYDDDLFPEAARAVISANMASVSMLQRHFKIGYARAGRLIDMLEQAGIIGPHVGSKSRDVLATEEDLEMYGL